MKLVKCRSKKHKGCIFLKQEGTDDFVLKIYARDPPGDEEVIAGAIIDGVRHLNIRSLPKSKRINNGIERGS